jgi:type I restriction enzyme S subunit
VSAVLEVREPSARYLAEPELVRQFELLATSPGGVARLRELILELAVQGKLVSQEPSDESIDALLLQVQSSKLSAKRNKTSMPASEEEIPFQLPQGWRLVRIADVAILENGDRGSNYPSRDKFVKSGIAFINAGHLSDRRVDYGDMNYISPQHFESLRSGKVESGDILYCLRGSLGKFALVETSEPGAIASSLVIIRLLDKRFTPFFLRYLESPLASSLITRFNNGTAQPNLGAGDLARFVFPVPPLREQARIVTRVDELMRLCDALEDKGRLEAEQHARLLGTVLGTLTDSRTPEELAANWQRVADHFDLLLDRPEAVDALEETILQLAVRGLLVPQDPSDEPASARLEQVRREGNRLDTKPAAKRGLPSGEIQTDQEFCLPSGWAWVSLADLLPEFQNGVASRGDTGGRQITVLRLADIKARRVSLTDTRQIPIAERDVEKCRLRSGDILITRVNGSADIVGQFNLCEEDVDAIYCDHFIRMRVRDEWLDPAFAALLGESDLIRNQIRGLFITTAGQKTVNQGHIGSLRFALPPQPEQLRIVARVAELRRLCVGLRRRLDRSNATQSALSEALIGQALAA